MSGTVRAGLIFGLGAIGAVIGATLLSLVVPIPCIGFLSVVALGLGAGYTAAKTTNAAREQRIGRGAAAGAIAGSLVLIGGALGVALITQLPAYQAQIQQGVGQVLQQNPDFQDSGIDPAQIASFATGAAGVVGGVCGGIINFVTMLICGMLGALFWRGAPAAQYVPAGSASYGAPPSGSYIPGQDAGQSYNVPPSQPPGGQPPNPPSQEGGARIYDPNDPNRPQ